MSAKFFVYDGSVWREVTASGVQGWGRVQFVVARGGRLELARRGAVMRGLRALAAGKPTTVRDGPPLVQIRREDVKKGKAVEARRRGCNHCCSHAAPSKHLTIPALPAPPPTKDETFNCLLQSRADAGTQCGAVEVSVQTDVSADQSHLSLLQRSAKQNPGNSLKRKRSVSPHPDLPRDKRGKFTKRKKHPNKPPSRWRDTADSQEEVACKELIIKEEDITLLRRFMEVNDGQLFDVDLLRFDKDDNYKRWVFFKLNPIVNIERSACIDRMSREGRSRTAEVNLKDFVSMLGLRSIEEDRREADARRTRSHVKRNTVRSPTVFTDDTDKENATQHAPKPNVKRTKVLNDNDLDTVNVNSGREKSKTDIVKTIVHKKLKSSASDVRVNGVLGSDRGRKTGSELKKNDKPEKRVASPSKKVPRSKTREYSLMEDEAIVSWVRGAGRPHLVNGNRLWRELQPLHHRRTGQFRSWQSLRNRYLRHLLPRLAAHLPPDAAAALRAAAARGELKARKHPARRNSAFAEPRIRSAWARRPRPPRILSRSPSPPPARVPSSSSRSPSPARVQSPSSHSTSRPPARAASSSSRSPPPARPPRRSPELPPRSRRDSSSEQVWSVSSGSDSDDDPKIKPSMPKKKRDAADGSQTKVKRALRSGDAAEPRTPRTARTLTHTPTYSDITRRFASRPSTGEGLPPSTSTSSPHVSRTSPPPRPSRVARISPPPRPSGVSGASPPPRPPPPKSATPPRPPRVSRPSPRMRPSASRSPPPARPLRHSRSSVSARRSRRSHPSPPPSPSPPRPKRRRLYNPGQNL